MPASRAYQSRSRARRALRPAAPPGAGLPGPPPEAEEEAEAVRRHERQVYRDEAARRKSPRAADERVELQAEAQPRQAEPGGEPGAVPPERAEAEQYERRSKEGQEVVEPVEAEGHNIQRQAPADEVHGPAPGSDGLRHLCGRRVGEGLTEEGVEPAFIHCAHLPAPWRGVFEPVEPALHGAGAEPELRGDLGGGLQVIVLPVDEQPVPGGERGHSAAELLQLLPGEDGLLRAGQLRALLAQGAGWGPASRRRLRAALRARAVSQLFQLPRAGSKPPMPSQTRISTSERQSSLSRSSGRMGETT